MKTKEISLTNMVIVSHAPKQNSKHLARLARICAIATGIAIVPIHSVLADADDQRQQILPFPTVTESTIPTNGDVNPYGVAFVPQNFPAGGLLNPGDLLVSNFNNKLNLQGTGTTIIKVTPNGQTSLFFQGAGPLGLSTGLAVLKKGFVLVANCPTTGGAAPMAEQGSLLVIDRNGHLINTILSPLVQGPWDFTVHDEGNLVQVFVSNVLTGTVSRLDLLLDAGNVQVKSAAVIASGYLHRPDPATFEVGPTGLAYDHRRDILYVASTGDNEVFAVKNAGEDNQSRGMGQLIYRDQVHLHGALAMVLAPNGHLLVSNSDGINPDPNQPSEIVEFTVHGQFIGQLSVDPAEGGAFGLNIVQVADDVVRFAAVDDNANTITIWKLINASLTNPEQD
jgi:hypothetical protein